MNSRSWRHYENIADLKDKMAADCVLLAALSRLVSGRGPLSADGTGPRTTGWMRKEERMTVARVPWSAVKRLVLAEGSRVEAECAQAVRSAIHARGQDGGGRDDENGP
jgi:hypothetical protein